MIKGMLLLSLPSLLRMRMVMVMLELGLVLTFLEDRRPVDLDHGSVVFIFFVITHGD